LDEDAAIPVYVLEADHFRRGAQHIRMTLPSTSHEAYRDLDPQKVKTTMRRIVEELRKENNPLTAQELATRIKFGYYDVERRVTEMKKVGLLSETTIRHTNPLTKKSAFAAALTQKGNDWYDQDAPLIPQPKSRPRKLAGPSKELLEALATFYFYPTRSNGAVLGKSTESFLGLDKVCPACGVAAQKPCLEGDMDACLEGDMDGLHELMIPHDARRPSAKPASTETT
jgi:hypothetical protein